jgi:hypothetical protein
VTPLGAPPMRDRELLTWCEQLLDAIFGEELAGHQAGPAGGSEPASS